MLKENTMVNSSSISSLHETKQPIISFNVSQSTLAKGHFNFTPTTNIESSLLNACGLIKDKPSLRYSPMGTSNYVLTTSKGINLASIRLRSKGTTNNQYHFQIDLSNSCNVAWRFKAIAIESDETGVHLPRLKVISQDNSVNYYRWTINHTDLNNQLGLINLKLPKDLIASYSLPSKSSNRMSELNFYENNSSNVNQEELLLFVLFLSATLSTNADVDIFSTSSPASTPPNSRPDSCRSSANTSRSNSTKSIETKGHAAIPPALVTRKSSEVLMGDHLW